MSHTASLADHRLVMPPRDLAGPRNRQWLRTLKSRTLSTLSTMLGAVGGTPVKTGFGILMYHRVAEPVRGFPAPTWNVAPRRFERQLAGLLRRGFEPWPLRKVLEQHHAGQPIPRKAFVVTFDDGYENVYLNAFPVLQRLKIPATVFLATAYLDFTSPFPCDDWVSAGNTGVPDIAWRPMTTEQCRTMQASGLIELGAHTHTHQDFRGRPDVLREDLRRCQEFLKDRFGIAEATFAFPYGTKHLGFAGPPLNEVTREVGLLCSLTTESQLVQANQDPFDWGRFNAEAYDTAASLSAKLKGWYETLRRLRKRVAPHTSATGARQ